MLNHGRRREIMNSNENKITRICGFGVYGDEKLEDIKIEIESKMPVVDLIEKDEYKFLSEILKSMNIDKKIIIVNLKEKNHSPFIWHDENSARFVVSCVCLDEKQDEEIWLTIGMVSLFQKVLVQAFDRDKEKKVNIFKGIIECCLASSVNEKQAEYLAEEVYLIYKKSTGYLKDGVLSLFKNTADRILKEDNKKNCKEKEKAAKALEEIIGKVECAENRCNKKRILKYLLECDLNDNEKERSKEKCLCGESIGKIVIKNKSLRYKDIMFLHECGTLYLIGDTHGDSYSTEYIIKDIEKSLKKDDFVVFLGDFVNNGLRSIENLITVLEFKNKHRDNNNVILLSGNHEFRETYLTVLKEYFETYWNNSILHPFPFRRPPTHYGHIRLELITMFGVKEGEEIYELFEQWGRSLPYIAFSQKGVMMSHSIGLPPAEKPSLENLAKAKENEIDIDIEKFDKLGYEAWKKHANTIHSKMVNEKEGIMVSEKDSTNSALSYYTLNYELLEKFRPLGVNVFVVGNTHYRSGDIDSTGIFTTICSSCKESPDAGHYMYQEMVVESFEKKDKNKCENDKNKGNRYKEGRPCKAKPCYVKFECNTVTQIKKEENLILF
jgi:hypothetical protein